MTGALRTSFRVALLACALAPLAAHGGDRLLVVMASDKGPYLQALTGLQKAFPAVDAMQVTANDDPEVARAVARLPRDGAIVTLGQRAARLVAGAAPTSPVVNCMVIGDPEPRAGGAVVVPLEVPLDVQAAWLARLLPKARNVGMLYDPAQNAKRVADIAAGWKRAGFAPVLEPVASATALPSALARLTNSVDVLHAIPDTTVFAPEHSRPLLLFSFRHRIPLAGPSEGWVRAGALYAVDWDYADLGRYCGALALRQLAGPKAPAPPPPRTRVIANARSAELLGVRWSDETRKSFDRIYE